MKELQRRVYSILLVNDSNVERTVKDMVYYLGLKQQTEVQDALTTVVETMLDSKEYHEYLLDERCYDY